MKQIIGVIRVIMIGKVLCDITIIRVVRIVRVWANRDIMVAYIAISEQEGGKC